MNSVTELHDEAMRLAEAAVVKRLSGDAQQANLLFRQAYEKEAQAAGLMANELSVEPTRSVLYRSAASLALDCGLNREAERLIAVGLAGNPPDEIAEELRELFERANFERHLSLRGLMLEPNEIQMSIAGDQVSPGIAPSEPFISRVLNARTLIYRTVERMMNRPYREGGAASRVVKEYGLFISAPRAASFAVSLRIGGPRVPLPGFTDDFGYVEPSAVVDEVLEGLELVNGNDEQRLRMRIPDEAYFRNFVGVAKNIVPDGKEVKLVGFTAVRRGAERRIELTRPRRELTVAGGAVPVGRGTPMEPRSTTITGRLKFADAVESQKQAIKLVDDAGRPHRIIVPEGLMSDIVKPLWEERVEVTGHYRRRALYLEDISPVSSD